MNGAIPRNVKILKPILASNVPAARNSSPQGA
jgi:hypothetical protein